MSAARCDISFGCLQLHEGGCLINADLVWLRTQKGMPSSMESAKPSLSLTGSNRKLNECKDNIGAHPGTDLSKACTLLVAFGIVDVDGFMCTM